MNRRKPEAKIALCEKAEELCNQEIKSNKEWLAIHMN